MSRAKAVQLLLKKNYNVYIPIANDITLVLELNNEFKKCLVRPCYEAERGKPIASIAHRTGGQRRFVNEEMADYILVVDNDKLWLLPMEDVAAFTSVRLGKKWEHCILPVNVIVAEEKKMSKDIEMELRRAAREAVERLG